jgi:histidinol-phosphate/aromatic aminotransferase/cobyric acid decarboxylase-like protein
VTMLLRELAQLATGGDVLVERHAHPDLPAWARARGSRVEVVEDDLARRIDETGPALAVLDRPTIEGRVIGLDDLRRLAAAAEDSGTVVIVDESYATYFGPAASAAPLTLEASNLLVLRGVSKGYCTGGLRVGYAVASAPLAPAVREVACPLAVSSLALGFALELLAAGDVFAPLRARLAVTKPATVEALARLGIEADPTHPALPWVIAPAAAEEVLTRRGIAARRVDGLLRVAVPLSDARLATLQRLS